MDSFYKFNFYMKMAYVAIVANKLRSFLSILGIVFGIVAVLIIICLGEGAKKEIVRQIELLGIKNVYIKSVPQKQIANQGDIEFYTGLNSQDVDIIKSISHHVEECAAIRELYPSVIGENKEITHQIISVSPSFFRILDLKFFIGRPILDQDVQNNNLTAVLGYKTAMSLGNNATPGKFIRLGNNIFKIVGTLAPFGGKKAGSTAISARNLDELIIVPFGTEKWIGTQGQRTGKKNIYTKNYVSEIIVKTKSSDHVIEAADLIRMILARKYLNKENYQIVTPFALLNRSKETKDMFNLFLLVIASVSLLVGGIGIMNIMLATVSERRREIGIRRSVGAKQRHILIQFLIESILLTITGGMIGIVLGTICILILGKISPWPVIITPGSIFIPLIISTLTGVCSGSYPAFKAAQMSPVEALAT